MEIYVRCFEKQPYVSKADKRKTECNKNIEAYNKRIVEGPADDEESDKSRSEVDEEEEGSRVIYVLCVPSGSAGEPNWLRKDVVQEFVRLDLQGDIFSSPMMIGGRIFVGCRDDYLYCLGLEIQILDV